ncbi:hypothetical protein BDW74DRAFT_179150 [Aspergillus multicolor]|uniref:uncharacterized protein n=1 Tax=Aspergillus multicolor TaxID=41759 RepID=UPI003CCE09C6
MSLECPTSIQGIPLTPSNKTSEMAIPTSEDTPVTTWNVYAELSASDTSPDPSLTLMLHAPGTKDETQILHIQRKSSNETIDACRNNFPPPVGSLTAGSTYRVRTDMYWAANSFEHMLCMGNFPAVEMDWPRDDLEFIHGVFSEMWVFDGEEAEAPDLQELANVLREEVRTISVEAFAVILERLEKCGILVRRSGGESSKQDKDGHRKQLVALASGLKRAHDNRFWEGGKPVEFGAFEMAFPNSAPWLSRKCDDAAGKQRILIHPH